MKKVFNFSLLAAAMMVILSACSGGSTPSDVAEKYGDYLMSGKYEKIADMVDTEEMMSSKEEIEEGKKQLTALMQMVGEQVNTKYGGFKKFEVISETIDGEKANVVTKITYGNGTEEESDLDLILKDGKWLLEL